MLRVELGRAVNWSAISREDHLLSMERSPVKDAEIKALLKIDLSDELGNVTLVARSIDASNAYENYAAYRAEDL